MYTLPPNNGVDSDKDSDDEEGCNVEQLSANLLNAPAEFQIDFGTHTVNSVQDESVIFGDVASDQSQMQSQEVEVLDCYEQKSSDDDAEEDMTESDFESKRLSSSKHPHTKHIWRKKDFQRNKFVTVQDPQPQQLDSATPISIFELFFDDEVIQFMVNMTNLYARRDKLNHHFKIDNNQMRLLMAMLLLTGYTCLPRRRLYWETETMVTMLQWLMQCLVIASKTFYPIFICQII